MSLNRKQRRRIERQKAKEQEKQQREVKLVEAQNSKKYYLSYDDMKKQCMDIIDKEQELIYEAARLRAMIDVFELTTHALHDEFSFGKKRLVKLFDRIEEKIKCIEAGELHIDDIIEQNKKEIGYTTELIANSRVTQKLKEITDKRKVNYNERI